MNERVSRAGPPNVFTNGVFDLLHVGHIRYLAKAAELGILTVGVNSNRSAGLLGKGEGRPINTAEDRAEILRSLRFVNRVIVFNEPNPIALIESLMPDVYVKGGDYDIETLPETALVRSWGGVALSIPFVAGYSTTGTMERILDIGRR